MVDNFCTTGMLRADFMAKTRKAVGKSKCSAAIWHGPGHQSKTECQRIGKHIIHEAIYGSAEQAAQWRGEKAFSGFFDEPPTLKSETRRKRFVVYGHAFVPVQVRIEIEAANADAAMKAANKKLKTHIRRYIVAGSEDEGAAWGFDANHADRIK